MGRLASLFSPFWCLGAKGGELFYLGYAGFAWVAVTSLPFPMIFIACTPGFLNLYENYAFYMV